MYDSKKRKNLLNRLKLGLNQNRVIFAKNILPLAVILILAACASVQQPGGGPKDTQAPKVLKEKPKNLSTRFAAKEIEIEFDEFVKLTNEFSEVSVSPALENQPIIKVQKEKLTIKLEEQLQANTTYTINFGKAIGDVNENNILKNYSYVFSTGEVLDSLAVSGNVKSALTNEQLKDALVFIFPADQDTLFGKKKPAVYTQTDSAGNFSLRNLKAGKYHIYALTEKSNDRIYQQGEDEIGFIDTAIVLQKNVNDINFRVFKEAPAKFIIKERKIESDGSILLSFNKGISKPEVKEVDGNILSKAKKEFNTKGDSLRIWFQELDFDSLKLAIYSDTQLLEKVAIGRNKKENINRSPVITDNLAGNKLKPGTDLIMRLSYPITNLDSTKIQLTADSVEQVGWKISKIMGSDREYRFIYPFRVGKLYRLEIKEGAFTAFTGLKSKAYVKDLLADDPENYGNLSLTVNPAKTDQQYVLQLIDEREHLIREDIIKGKGILNYNNYPVGKYAIRIVLDENGNGTWDSGNFEKKKQPEKTWNYNKVITLRANWDLEETITLPQDW